MSVSMFGRSVRDTTSWVSLWTNTPRLQVWRVKARNKNLRLRLSVEAFFRGMEKSTFTACIKKKSLMLIQTRFSGGAAKARYSRSPMIPAHQDLCGTLNVCKFSAWLFEGDWELMRKIHLDVSPIIINSLWKVVPFVAGSLRRANLVEELQWASKFLGA